MKKFFSFLLTFVIVLLCVSVHAQSKHQQLKNDRYVVIVSMDGFRWDYNLMYETPFLDSLAQAGTDARMRPSYPSKTFPNHYTIATGLVPDHHGIIANKFTDCKTGRKFSLSNPETKYDGSFYGGEPIWITAQRQGVNAGIVYWPGSDVEIQGIRPYVYHVYDDNLLPFDERIDEVKRILTLPEAERPHLVMCYFSEPDATGHKLGPYTPKMHECVRVMDQMMRELYGVLQELPFFDKIDFIVTSDHGMTRTSPERMIRLSEYVKPEWVKDVLFSVPSWLHANKIEANGVVIDYADSIVDALKDVPHLQAWRRCEVPEYLQFGTNENIGDVVLNTDLGWIVGEEYKETTGTHGYDPFFPDMHVNFRAIGPDFKQGYVKEDIFQNTCVYPLICHLLGLTPVPVDGNLEDISDILK